MRRLLPLAPLFCLLFAACSSGTGSDGSGGVRELTAGRTATGAIDAVGQVDWYRYRVTEPNTLLQVTCTAGLRPTVDFLVTVYRLDADGSRVPLYGEHAPEETVTDVDIEINLHVDAPAELLIAVRDLRDDEASDQTYNLTVSPLGPADGDGDFATATRLTVDDPADPPANAIEHIGDVDCYAFDVAADGVYEVAVDYTRSPSDPDVDLQIELYDGASQLLQTVTGSPSTSLYRLRRHLVPGAYHVVVEDYGMDDSSRSSPYTVTVRSVAADEVGADDTRESAAAMAADAAGAIAYTEDQDWYRIPTGAAAVQHVKLLDLTFAGGTAAEGRFRYEIELTDEAGTVLLSHQEAAGGAGLPYHTQVRAGTGDHYLRVRAAEGQVPTGWERYELTVEVLDVDDPDEAGAGNDTPETALPLAPSAVEWHEGRLLHQGDVDVYAVDADRSRAQILEVYLETDEASAADYAVSVLRDGVEKRVVDAYGGDGPTRLKTSLYVPAAGSPPDPVRYYVRVADLQGDEGDALVPYRVRLDLVDVPEALPPAYAEAGTLYHGEVAERQTTDHVLMDHNAHFRAAYPLDRTTLAFNGPTPPEGVVRTTSPDDGTTTITLPWVAGYIDHQGDQDWFELELAPFYTAADAVLDTAWYYDLQVELRTADGSPVEYTWKLYRDANADGSVVEWQTASNGFFASAGDPTTAEAAFDLVVPDAGTDPFWVGNRWGGSRFYLAVSDFNYVEVESPAGSGTIVPNELPDDDWGYGGSPYYLRVTLVYHPGVSNP